MGGREVNETLEVPEHLLRPLHEEDVKAVSGACKQFLDDLVQPQPRRELPQIVENRETLLQRLPFDCGEPRVVGSLWPFAALEPPTRLTKERPAAPQHAQAGDGLVPESDER